MLETIFSSIGLGLGLAIMIGPAFFSLLQTSIDRGFRSAARLAFGIFLSDVFLVGIVFFGAASVLGKPMVKELVGLVGGGILIGFGVYTFLNRGKGLDAKAEAVLEEAEVEHLEKIIVPKDLPNSIVFVVKGFLLNLANPATWFFWVFWVGVVSTQYTDDSGKLDIVSLIIFFSCTLLTVLLTDVLKAYIAHQLRQNINEKVMANMNMLFGLVLVGFGAFLIVKSIYPIIQPMLNY